MGNDCPTLQQQLMDLENFRTSGTKLSKERNIKPPATNSDVPSATNSTPTSTDNSTPPPSKVSTTPPSNDSTALPSRRTTTSTLPQLSDITQQSDSSPCGEGMVYKVDFIVAGGDKTNNSNPWNKIPKLIHQTSKSRCLIPSFIKATTKWSDWYNDGWSYYFHDDEAMHRMFEMNYDIFPLLKDVVENCLVSGTAKADLWRYLILWHYGGIYSDIDTTPHNLSPGTFDVIATEETPLEAFFIIEAFHFLSQYFFAIAPRHPLMYHTIMETVHKLLATEDHSAFDASMVTGPKALHRGFVNFLLDVGIVPENGRKGFGKEYRHKYIIPNATIMGTGNHTIASYGISKDADFWVWRYDKDVQAKHKKAGYQSMGMEHFGKFKKRAIGISCHEAIKERHRRDISGSYSKAKV